MKTETEPGIEFKTTFTLGEISFTVAELRELKRKADAAEMLAGALEQISRLSVESANYSAVQTAKIALAAWREAK
jgi:hypothetical protein